MGFLTVLINIYIPEVIIFLFSGVTTEKLTNMEGKKVLIEIHLLYYVNAELLTHLLVKETLKCLQ